MRENNNRGSLYHPQNCHPPKCIVYVFANIFQSACSGMVGSDLVSHFETAHPHMAHLDYRSPPSTPKGPARIAGKLRDSAILGPIHTRTPNNTLLERLHLGVPLSANAVVAGAWCVCVAMKHSRSKNAPTLTAR